MRAGTPTWSGRADGRDGTRRDKLPNLARYTHERERDDVWGETHAIPASPRTSRCPCPRDPARDSGSPGPRPAPSSPLTSSPQEYTTLARSDSLRAQSPCNTRNRKVVPRSVRVNTRPWKSWVLLRRTLFQSSRSTEPASFCSSDGGSCTSSDAFLRHRGHLQFASFFY